VVPDPSGGRTKKNFKAQIAQPKCLIGKMQVEIAQEKNKIGKAQEKNGKVQAQIAQLKLRKRLKKWIKRKLSSIFK